MILVVNRVTLPAEMSQHDKALTICTYLKAAGLEANGSVVLVYNLSDNDRGRTDHRAVAIVKPTGTAEEQMKYLCALILRWGQRPSSSSNAVPSRLCGTERWDERSRPASLSTAPRR